MSALLHRTVFETAGKVAVSLPFNDELREHHPAGSFPLLKDPLKAQETTIIGMFVLRPAKSEPYNSKVFDDEGRPASLFAEELDWAFNVNGLDGGGLISNNNTVDAYRLGMQYGLSDAVIVGTASVCNEGVTHGEQRGYLWQPYGPLSWGHVQAADPHLTEKILRQRSEWQGLGYLSARNYPAQVIFSWTGEHHPPACDFLTATVFHEKHPDGQPIEVYIVTSEKGAATIRERCARYGLEERIEEMLIVLPSLPDYPSSMDLSLLPKILYSKYDIRIADHDGGQVVLREFAKAGIIDQMNLTLCRKQNLLKVIASRPDLTEDTKRKYLEEFDERVLYFFGRDRNERCRGVPRELEVVSVIEDSKDEILVVTFAMPDKSLDWWK